MVKTAVLNLSAALLLTLSSALQAADTGSAREPVLGLDAMQIQDTRPKDSPGNNGETAPVADEIEQDIKKYQEAILETERTSGAYGAKLWEQLVGLATAQQNAGRYQAGVASLNQALHINRVNHGLHNIEQEPIINLLIKNNTALKDWKALEQNYQYLYWLYRRVYGENDMRLLPVINRIGLWHLKAYTTGKTANPFADLMTAQSMYNDAVHIIEINRGKNDPEMISPLNGIMLTNYLMAIHASGNNEGLRSSFSISNQPFSRCDDFSFYRRNPLFDDCSGSMGMNNDERDRQQIIILSYQAGKRALTRSIDIYENNPALPAVEHALAYIRLGDWYMLFNRPSAANSEYTKAYAQLKNTDDMTREKLFGTPKQLPEVQYNPVADNKPKADARYVLVSMDVSKNGRVRNIQVVESRPPDDKNLINLATKSLRQTRFRPRIENGEPVATSGYKKMFVFE